MKIQEFLHLCNVLDPGITLKKFKISIHDTHNEAINENWLAIDKVESILWLVLCLLTN